MSVQERILTCRLLEKMKVQGAYGKQLGLENVSRMHGLQMNQSTKGWQRKDR